MAIFSEVLFFYEEESEQNVSEEAPGPKAAFPHATRGPPPPPASGWLRLAFPASHCRYRLRRGVYRPQHRRSGLVSPPFPAAFPCALVLLGCPFEPFFQLSTNLTASAISASCFACARHDVIVIMLGDTKMIAYTHRKKHLGLTHTLFPQLFHTIPQLCVTPHVPEWHFEVVARSTSSNR